MPQPWMSREHAACRRSADRASKRIRVLEAENTALRAGLLPEKEGEIAGLKAAVRHMATMIPRPVVEAYRTEGVPVDPE